MSAPEPQATTAAIDVLYDYLWEPDDATSREECAQVVVDILRASNIVPAEALRALIEKWRERTVTVMPSTLTAADTERLTWAAAATELEQALADSLGVGA